MRINKFVSTNSLYSRRKVDKLIADGLVFVNGVTAVISQDIKDGDKVTFEDKALVYQEGSVDYVYYKFNKPPGVITSFGDDRGRANLNDYLELGTIQPGYSGRLDYASSGLLLISNNGELLNRLQSSKFGIEKEYVVKTDRTLTPEQLREFGSGLTLRNGTRYKKCKILPQANNRYIIILTEGKNRQIRNMFEHFNIKVTQLMRVRIANINLDKMSHGYVEELNPDEIEDLMKMVDLPFDKEEYIRITQY